MPSFKSARRSGRALDRSGLPEALPALGPTLGAAQADVAELAIVEGGEVAARAVAVMPQREREEDAAANAPLPGFADQGEDVKDVLHGRTMPLGRRSALRPKPKHLLE
jgi:hypothetical protein